MDGVLEVLGSAMARFSASTVLEAIDELLRGSRAADDFLQSFAKSERHVAITLELLHSEAEAPGARHQDNKTSISESYDLQNTHMLLVI